MTNTKKIVEISPNELGEILMQFKTVKGASIFASIVQFTDAKAVKKHRVTKVPNPYEIYKLSCLSIMLNTDYVTGVKKQLEREHKETTEYKQGINTMPLDFGENNQFIGYYNGELVLQYRPYDNSKPKIKYIDRATMKILDKDKVADFLPPKKVATNQGTDKEIFWRKLYLTNIRKLKFNGTTYKIVQ